VEAHLFWFNDEQSAKIAPLPPANQPGPHRKDHRLVLSGIMQVLKARKLPASFPPEGKRGNEAGARGRLPAGGLPEGVWPPQDDLQSLCPLERARNLAEDIRDGRRSFRAAGTSRVG
jgi:hypothetical protein